MARVIKDAPQQNLYGQPQVQFRPTDFDAAIWSHGYDIICEKAIRCPCQGNSGAPLPNCQNCHGFGYVFINPVRTKALITGLNRSTQYVQWNPELMGTAAITVRDCDKESLSYFDRVTVEDEYAQFTEMVVARQMAEDTVGVFLSYAPLENGIVAVYIFKDSYSPLIKLSQSVYSIAENNPYCLVFRKGNVPEGAGVSVLYRHRVEYHVVDLPHEIRASLGKDKLSGRYEILKMPIQAIGRRTHLIDMQRPNFDGTGIILNDDK